MSFKEARIAAGYSQEALAESVFVVRQTIGNIENGLALPSLPLAILICKKLGCSWDIFFRDGELENYIRQMKQRADNRISWNRL